MVTGRDLDEQFAEMPLLVPHVTPLVAVPHVFAEEDLGAGTTANALDCEMRRRLDTGVGKNHARHVRRFVQAQVRTGAGYPVSVAMLLLLLLHRRVAVRDVVELACLGRGRRRERHGRQRGKTEVVPLHRLGVRRRCV